MHRRCLLTLGFLSAAVLAIGGGALALLKPGLHDGRLSESGRVLFSSVSRAILDGSLPASDADLNRALQGLLGRIDALVAALPPPAQSELSQLLALLGSAAGRRGLAGLDTPWQEATIAQIQLALQGMRVSGVDLRRQAYQALHDIAGSAYFSDPSTWSILGYPGPLRI